MASRKGKSQDMDATKKYNIKTKNKKSKKKNKRKMDPKKKKTILMVFFIIVLILLGILFGFAYGIIKQAKEDVAGFSLKYENSIVVDSDGNVIAELSGDQNRKIIKKEEMSPYLLDAFVAIEDERFYDHMGIDVKRTLGATAKYVLSKVGIGSSSYGGSTITQQVVKNLTEETDRTWQRKVKEMARAYYLEKELSKDEILELYLNLIYMGGNTNIYGVEVASEYYFSKTASELDLAESAFLAGINNSPNSYDPFVEDNTANLERIKNRTKTVLDKMLELDQISEDEYNEAVAEVEGGIAFNKGTIVETVYSYHTDAAILQIINQLKEEKNLTDDAAKLYLYSGGFTIYTTQDTDIQNSMDEESQKSKYINTSNGQQSQAGMVLIDQSTGYVLGVIGGLGEKTTSLGLNRGTQAVKQTGSSMKPLAVVAPGIDQGYITAGTVYDDAPYLDFKNYNYFKGLINIRYAIESSQNIPMLKAIQTIGTQNSLEFLESLGFSHLDEDKDNNISLALGGLTNGATPLEMAAAYAAIANDGVYIEPTFYTKVVDSDGNTILEPNQETRRVMSKDAAFIVKDILTQPVKTGTATACAINGMSVAAKTGTTNDDYDRWLCGFTPYYTAATWYGYDENRTVSGWSLSPATQIWSSIMTQAHSGLEGKTFEQPDGVITATICKDSGLLATDACKNDQRGDRTYTEYFIKGTVPTEECTTHVTATICKDSGMLANEYCTNTETKVYITRPNSDTDTSWRSAADAQYMLTTKSTCTIHTEEADLTLPEIELNGDSKMTIELNSKFTDPGATATDDRDGDLTDKITVSGSVNTSKAGTYKLTYSVKDSAGNETSITRTVVVKDNSITNSTTNNTTNNTINNSTDNTTTNTSTTNTNESSDDT